jgi:hypothetical protein
MDETPADYRKHQPILGFPQRYSNDVSSSVIIKARCGRSSESNILSGFDLHDLRYPSKIIHSEEFKEDVIMESPPPYVGSGKEVPFETEVEISKEVLYEGEFRVFLRNEKNQNSPPIDFIVRDLKKVARVGLMHPLYTWQAYNTENGGSFYWGDDFEKGKICISLNRALPANSQFHSIKSVMPFVSALDNAEIPFRSFCNHDLHNCPELIEDLDVIVIVGHDEYWSHTIRDSLEGFVKKGGDIASFAGNTGWWAIDVDGDELYVDKTHQDDRMNFDGGTGQFKRPWISKPIQTLMGMSYQYAGYPVSRFPYDVHASGRIDEESYDSSGDLIILENEHPVFSGLPFQNGSRWGGEEGVLGVEIDGVLLEDNSVAHYRMEGVPMEIRVLAKSLVQCSGGMIDTDGNFSSGISFQEVGVACESTPFPGGGNVVNFGSIGYYNAVSGPDSFGEKIFINSVSYLLNRVVEAKTPSVSENKAENNLVLSLERKDDLVEVEPLVGGVLVIDGTQSGTEFHTIISSKFPLAEIHQESLVFDISWEIQEEEPGVPTKMLVIIEYVDAKGALISRHLHPLKSRLIGYQLADRITEAIPESLAPIESIRVQLYQNKEQQSRVLIHKFHISNVDVQFSFSEKQ